MDSNNQRLVLALGAVAAVIAAVVIGLVIRGKTGKSAAPPASQGGLQVSMTESATLDPQKKLRCFVDGQPVGEFSLAECAQKNGVAAQALDVGLDDSGALAAAPTASMAPPPALPPVAAAAPAPSASVPSEKPADQAQTAAQPAEARGPGSACLRFTGSEWRQLSESISLSACVQELFAGRCVRPGEADYGRWGATTLRLVPGRVEQSNDNRNFRTLVEQRRGCEIPPVR